MRSAETVLEIIHIAEDTGEPGAPKGARPVRGGADGKVPTEQLASRLLHLVILSRGHAAEALAGTRAVMTKLGLMLNEAKTSVKDARRESFDFLGYTFGPHRYRKDGHWDLGASPSKTSVQRVKAKVGDLLVAGNKEPWPQVCHRLNRLLLGWSGYFGYGTGMPAHRAVDNPGSDRVRAFLRKRHKVQGRGTTRFSDDQVFGEFGVLRLRRVHLGPPPCASR